MTFSYTAEEPVCTLPTVHSRVQNLVAELDGGFQKPVTSNLLFANIHAEHQTQYYYIKHSNRRYCDLTLHHWVPDL
jgi:hypothetical protein